MAVSENDTSDCNSDSSVDGIIKERKERPFTKAIIRRLPPTMTKEVFLNQVSPVPEYDYMYFVKADMSLGEYAFSRAYINFKNSSDIFIFKEKFDNYVFLDAKGNEYLAVVEFAPFSRIPKKRNKNRVDPKCGTVESDPIYIDFLESLKEVSLNENEEKPEYCFQPTAEEEKAKTINTPLLDFIKQRRIDRQKMKEEKREERKRKELERKRFKEEERRRRTRNENPSYNIGKSAKNVQILNSPKESSSTHAEDKKDEMSSKFIKERKYEDKYERKLNMKDDKKFSYQKMSKEIRKPSDDMYKKSPSKMRLRTYEKPDLKPKVDTKRKEDTYRSSRRINEYKEIEEERVIEKKVKKYSERREERKNEIKKLETLKSEDKRKDTEIKEEVKETKEEEITEITEFKEVTEFKENMQESTSENVKHSDDSDDKNDDDQNKSSKENDPRSQRRIRNKDRPSLIIYQPGMGLGRHKKQETTEVKADTT